MGKIENYVEFVKEQVGVQQKLAKKYESSPYRKGQHLASAKNFAELEGFLTEIQTKGTQDTSYLNRGDSPQKRLLLTFEEIDGLPEELLKELNVSDTDKQDFMVEHLIAQAGGILSLDKIMIELYRRTGEIPKRNTITSRLYRMAGKGMIYNVPAKKGVYSTYEVTEQEVKKLFGNVEADEEPAVVAATETTQSPQVVQEPATPEKPTSPQVSKFKNRYMNSTFTGRRA